MSEAIYDTIIIGGGPAGAAATVYAARKKLKALIITSDFGGQSAFSSDIENGVGEEKLTGFELAEKLEKHVRRQHDIEVKMPERPPGTGKRRPTARRLGPLGGARGPRPTTRKPRRSGPG